MKRPGLSFRIGAAALLGVCLAGAAVGAGNPERGYEKSLSCQACHGPDGNSPVPTFPKIAGQHQDYLLRSLLDYKSGVRTNAIMAALVVPLTEQDMEDLAAYYARQEGLRSIDAGLTSAIP